MAHTDKYKTSVTTNCTANFSVKDVRILTDNGSGGTADYFRADGRW